MSLGLSEYIDSLDERRDLLWPKPPPPSPLKVTASLHPLPGIRVVTWSVYGTLLQIEHGRLLHRHPQPLMMEIALTKVITEFKLWNNMIRKPGQPWEYLLRQYAVILEEAGMVSTKKKGDVPEVDSRKVWKKLLERLIKNEYQWDQGLYGGLDDLAAKVAYFFHASLQGTAATEFARETLLELTRAGIRCGLLADAQAFTLPQIMRDLRQQGPIVGASDLLCPDYIVLSSQLGVKKPSESLYREMLQRFKQHGIAPEQVLHVTHRLQDDLAVAKKFGFQTALFAADRNTCRVQVEDGPQLKWRPIQLEDVRNPEWKPDRLISNLRQVREILTI